MTGKKNMAYIDTEIFLSFKEKRKDETHRVSQVNWWNLKKITPSDVTQTQKDKSHIVFLEDFLFCLLNLDDIVDEDFGLGVGSQRDAKEKIFKKAKGKGTLWVEISICGVEELRNGRFNPNEWCYMKTQNLQKISKYYKLERDGKVCGSPKLWAYFHLTKWSESWNLYFFKVIVCFYLKVPPKFKSESSAVSRLFSTGGANIQVLSFRNREVDMLLPQTEV